MHPFEEHRRLETRRHFLASSTLNLGAAAVASLLSSPRVRGDDPTRGRLRRDDIGGLEGIRTFAPKATRVIFLFQSGGPSHLDLYDYKPALAEQFGKDIPASVRKGQRLTGFTKDQKRLPVAPSKFRFERHGEGGAWLAEPLFHTAKVADEICFVKSIHSEAINHDPARTLIQTGAQLAGRPSMGTWISYGLGSECQNLPAFMVLNSYGSCKRLPQPVTSRLWGAGFLPSQYQGVKLQSVGDPILYVSNPRGVDRTIQGRSLDALSRLNAIRARQVGDPEIRARIEQYELAFRMQSAVPELMDTSDEPEETFQLYGDNARKRGTYAANCLLARRMAERGVRFMQLYHVGWDHHEDVPRDVRLQCGDVDQPTAGLITDLKRRGMLDDTLIIWGGEFGRTVFTQGKLTKDVYGRDHHPYCFTMWLAGGGIRGGMTHGSSDDYGYNPAENPVHIHDLQATILHLLGIDHTKLTHRFQGREYRLTDVHGKVVREILA